MTRPEAADTRSRMDEEDRALIREALALFKRYVEQLEKNGRLVEGWSPTLRVVVSIAILLAVAGLVAAGFSARHLAR